MVGDGFALIYAGVRVELPVDAEIDSAASILGFRLTEAVVFAHDAISVAAIAVGRSAAHFIGLQPERVVVSPIEIHQHAERCAAERRMAGWVRGERRREIRAALVARRRAERRPI